MAMDIPFVLSIISVRERRAPPSSFPPNMCPLRPCSLPTTTGVFVRDTAEWLAYSPAVTAKILASYGLSVSDLTATGDAVKERPGSPRSVLGGAPSMPARPYRGTLALGSLGLGGGAYTLDTGTGLQVSPRGFSRQILFVFADTASRDRFARTLSACGMKCETAVAVAQGVTTRSTGKAISAISSILLAPVHVISRVFRFAERVALHFQLAAKRKKEEQEKAAQLAARLKKEAEAAKRKKEAADKVLRDVEKILKTNKEEITKVTNAYRRTNFITVTEAKLDHKLPHVERFVKLAASKSSEILLGYHGTSASSATAIMAGGFRPKKRIAPRGAYFSGNHGTSFDYAARKGCEDGSGGSILLVALARESYLGNNSATSSPGTLIRRVGGDIMDQNVGTFEEFACLPLAHIRGVC